MVPLAGLEPARCFHHLILSQARLPIPPQGHGARIIPACAGRSTAHCGGRAVPCDPPKSRAWADTPGGILVGIWRHRGHWPRGAGCRTPAGSDAITLPRRLSRLPAPTTGGRDSTSRSPSPHGLSGRLLNPIIRLARVVRPQPSASDFYDRSGDQVRSPLPTRYTSTIRRRLSRALHDEAVASTSGRLRGALSERPNDLPGAERSHRAVRSP
jgi:hypothetical protein